MDGVIDRFWFAGDEGLQMLLKIIVCTVDPDLARSRFIQRGLSDPKRLKFHGDWDVCTAQRGIELPLKNYNPPLLSFPTIEVDTSDEYCPNLDDIESFLRKD
ncbi:hypothetical protein H6F67_09725 [Microcoleus sp. FACHB-1515]|uniref:hypothetical protein n=1 Tax=Cyanophyceae TaxID=3028117 RepID=UPI001685D0C7|nr:hypothetical protein [Microcoleus sp. FACHB-1515]MBD2090131.1 hypothetical protein [Microcoleus sp. FACHB-1515]